MLTALPLNCTLKSDPTTTSSTDAMIAVLKKPFADAGVKVSDTVRVAALDIKPGVTSDEGEGDAWPALRATILAHDILIFGGPIWMGQIGSVAKRVSRTHGRVSFPKPTTRAGCPASARSRSRRSSATKDGAHMVSSQLFQALNDVGWTIPAVAACYWVGEAMGSIDFKDLPETPEKVLQTANTVAGNAAHLAQLLRDKPYPG